MRSQKKSALMFVHRAASIFAVLILVAGLTLACEEERKTGGSSGSSSGSSGAESPPEGHIKPGESQERATGPQARALANIRRMTNYLMSAASDGGAPADQAAAEEAHKQVAGRGWLNDPWGKPYIYEKTGASSFVVYSAGPDGQKGTDDDVRVE